jgi:uncharacterized membrane protein YozB (DUF420 family)
LKRVLVYRPFVRTSRGPRLDAKLLYWSLALANMAAVVALAARGVRAVRAGDFAAHRRAMTFAGVLVGAFLGSYVVKRLVLGPEDLDVWSTGARVNLWVHESFVLGMLLAGGAALVLGRRLARTRRVTGRAEDPAASAAALRRHRRFGWLAVVCSAFGLVTACGILAGMFARAGSP